MSYVVQIDSYNLILFEKNMIELNSFHSVINCVIHNANQLLFASTFGLGLLQAMFISTALLVRAAIPWPHPTRRPAPIVAPVISTTAGQP